jgi:hypothetical protein
MNIDLTDKNLTKTENEEMGIILEDDCLQPQSFFWFCEELLIRYQENNNIGIITGSNYFLNRRT